MTTKFSRVKVGRSIFITKVTRWLIKNKYVTRFIFIIKNQNPENSCGCWSSFSFKKTAGNRSFSYRQLRVIVNKPNYTEGVGPTYDELLSGGSISLRGAVEWKSWLKYFSSSFFWIKRLIIVIDQAIRNKTAVTE